MEKALVDIPNNLGDKQDPLGSPQRSEGSFPEPFLGFTAADQRKAACALNNLNVSPGESTSSKLESPIRPRQSRTTKSRASLAWLKGGRFFDTPIKEEPVDDDNTTKRSPKKAVTVEDKLLKKIKSESEQEISNGSKTTKTPKSSGKLVSKSGSVKKINSLKGMKKFVSQNGTVRKLKAKKKMDTTSKLKKTRKDLVGIQAVKQETEEKAVVNGDHPSTSSAGPSNMQIRMANMRKRRIKKSTSKGFKCDECGNSYKYLRGLRQHKKLECNREPQFPCPYCPSRHRYRHSIREHVRNFHEAAFPKWYAIHYVKPVFDNMRALQNTGV